MVKFEEFTRPLSVFQVLFKANLIFKTVLYIQVLFKPVRTLAFAISTQSSQKRRIMCTVMQTFSWGCINFMTQESFFCMFFSWHVADMTNTYQETKSTLVLHS